MRHFEIEYSDGERYLGHEIPEGELDEARKCGPVASFTDEQYEELKAHLAREAAYQRRWAAIENEWWELHKT